MSTTPEVILIAAVARNGVIGRENALPWRLKADLAHFKAATTGHPVLMGRKTWESLGRPLPGRRNVVITRNPDYVAEGAEVHPDPASALRALEGMPRVFVIGGAEIYSQLLPMANVLMLTEVAADVTGDAHFPAFDRERFLETSRTACKSDADNQHDFDFVEYRRKY